MPPEAVTVAEPVEPPLHNTFAAVVDDETPVAGCEMFTEFTLVQPFASVTVDVYTPAFNPVITDEVAVVDHR